MFSLKKYIAFTLVLVMVSPLSSVDALTLQQTVNNIQATDPALPTGVVNPKGYIGSLLSELFWGSADGAKNGKIKPQYLDVITNNIWTQSGSNAFYSGTGNVGIGTASPNTKLHIVNNNPINDGGQGQIVMENTSITGNAGINLRVNGPNLATIQFSRGSWQNTSTGGSFSYTMSETNPRFSWHTRINTEIIEKMVLTRDGNVGIGTTNPSDLLTLSGATATLVNLNGATTNYRGLKMSNTSGMEQWFAGANNANNYVIRQGGATDIMTFSSGNVGIGTMSPTNKLDIRAINYAPNQNGGIQIGTTNGFWISSFTIKSDVSGVARTAIDATDGTVNGATNEAISISTNGNIGIGTTSPTSKLQVVGLPVYANNSGALAGGLTAGAFYRTGADPDPVMVVH